MEHKHQLTAPSGFVDSTADIRCIECGKTAKELRISKNEILAAAFDLIVTLPVGYH